MTNKEFIQNEIDNLKDMLKNAKDLKCELIIKNSGEEIKQYKNILKELELLEKYKKVMCKPIQDLMKDLEKLELYEKVVPKMQEDGAYYKGQYYKQQEILDILKPYFSGAVFPSAILINFSPKEANLIKEWLNEQNDYY